jgi:Domain of unknown function (DUF6766)
MSRTKAPTMQWIRDRALTLVLMTMFLVFLAGQVIAGHYEYNGTAEAHGEPAVAMVDYLATGHLWEALFENWESEFLQMAAFILLTTFLSRRDSRNPGGQVPPNSSTPILGTLRTSRTRRGPSDAVAGCCASTSTRLGSRSSCCS